MNACNDWAAGLLKITQIPPPVMFFLILFNCFSQELTSLYILFHPRHNSGLILRIPSSPVWQSALLIFCFCDDKLILKRRCMAMLGFVKCDSDATFFQVNGVLGGNLLFDLIYRLSDGQVQEDTFSSSSSPACNPKCSCGTLPCCCLAPCT